MNDSIRRNGWGAMPQQNTCPNCGPQMAMAQPSPQMPFLSRGVQEMVEGNGTAGMSAINSLGNANDMSAASTADSAGIAPQYAIAESTSNYADLGMSSAQTTAPGGAGPQNAVTYRPESSSKLQGLVGNPSATELPGLTAINLANQTTAYGSQNLQYLNGFLITQIGRNVTVTFLVGSSSMDVRSGRLVGVGANYILLNEFETNDVVACDFYSIKFIKIYY